MHPDLNIFKIRFSSVEQLALYQMFHRDYKNRAIHYLALPIVIYSGLLPFAYLKLMDLSFITQYFSLNMGMVLIVLALASSIRLDPSASVVFAAWTIPLIFLAEMTIASLSILWVLLIVILGQFIGWYLAVELGHEKIEPKITYKNRPCSTNIYFQFKMFILKNVGKKPSLIDAWTQFIIGPFHSSLEILFLFGIKRKFKNRIDQQMEINLERFAKGKNIYPSKSI